MKLLQLTNLFQGLVPAVAELLPGLEHRFYVRHLHNFKQRHPGEGLKIQMWTCAKASYANKFEAEMEILKGMDPESHKWLIETTNPKTWSRAFFNGQTKCDVLNNHSESFNSIILPSRKKPILGLIEKSRVYLMVRHQGKRSWIQKKRGGFANMLKQD